MKKFLLTVICCLCLFYVQADIQEIPGTGVTLTSPDHSHKITFSQQRIKDGTTLSYTVEYKDKPVILPSNMGLELDNRTWEQALARDIKRSAKWYNDLVFDRVEYTSHNEQWYPVYGERNTVSDHWNGAIIHLKKENNSNYRMNIEIRAYNEGIAFRYLFPEHPEAIYHKVVADDTDYTFQPGTMAWCTEWAQGTYRKLSIPEWIAVYERPLTLELPNGLYAALTEADAADWGLIRFKKSNHKENTIATDQYSVVDMVTPSATPWKLIMVAETPGRLLENNDIILNLNPPCAIADTDWIKPGKIIREMTLTTENAIECIDFCVAHNMQYILFDWKWYGPATSFESDATQVVAPIDMPNIIQYAKEKGIGVWVYVNQHALQKQTKELFPILHKWGIVGVKFGFVQYASHRWSVWMHDMVKLAAENKLMVNIHDEYRPFGFSRTYPNLLTQEGIRGNEEFPDATHNTVLPFTRMISGAGDYTICYYDKRLKTTHAHQLAASLIFYSPLQTLYWYDKPSFYNREPEIEFFDNLPTIFDDSKVLSGEPGKQAIIARRSGEEWFVGGITNNEGSTETISLNFLNPETTYLASIYTDGGKEIKTETKVKCSYFLVDNKQTMTFNLKPSGGMAIRFIPVDSTSKKKYKQYKGQIL